MHPAGRGGEHGVSLNGAASEPPFAPLPDGPFGALLADPPWRYGNWPPAEQEKRGEQWGRKYGRPTYPTLSPEEICALPVAGIAAPDSVLFLWVTNPMLVEGLRVMEAWGFRYKSVAFTWAKQNPSGVGWKCGLGYWTRGNAEICLLGTRGSPKRVSNTVRSLIVAPVREHSRKPDETYTAIERLLGEVPRVELFARYSRPGWSSWGHLDEG